MASGASIADVARAADVDVSLLQVAADVGGCGVREAASVGPVFRGRDQAGAA